MFVVSFINFLTGVFFALQIILGIVLCFLVLLNRSEEGSFKKPISLGNIKTDLQAISKTTAIIGTSLIVNTICLNYMLLLKYKILAI